MTLLDAGICLRGNVHTRALKLRMPVFTIYTLDTANILTKKCTNLFTFVFKSTLWSHFWSTVPLIPLPPSVSTLALAHVKFSRDDDLKLFKHVHTLVLDDVLFVWSFAPSMFKHALSHLVNLTVRCRDPCYFDVEGHCTLSALHFCDIANTSWVSLYLSSTCLDDDGLVCIVINASHMRRLHVDNCRRLDECWITTADMWHLDVFSGNNTAYSHLNKGSSCNKTEM